MKYVWVTFLFWLIGLMVGLIVDFTIPPLPPETAAKLVQQNFSLVKIIGTKLSVLAIHVLGGLSFGGLTLISLCYNGFIMGKLLKLIYQIDPHLFLNLLPHSTEVLGFVRSGALGLRLGVGLFSYTFRGKREIKMADIKFFVYGLLGSVAIILFSGLVAYYISPNP